MANTKEQISRNMKSNKGKDTKPELLLRKELWRRGLRYRKNYKELYGKPDIVFLGARIAVFVDGKMWHGYDWEHQKDDFKSRRDYWIPKIEQNIEHDYEVTQELISLDWLVMRFWDFEIKIIFKNAQIKSNMLITTEKTVDSTYKKRRIKNVKKY